MLERQGARLMPDDDQVLIIYTTWPSQESAETCAREAVEARHAACVNLLGPIQSIYRWEGEVERAEEHGAIFKTTARSAEDLRALILENHPYETPCLIALQLEEPYSDAAYMAWLRRETGSTSFA
jgi:periplasmic divalent cation tolerance protein